MDYNAAHFSDPRWLWALLALPLVLLVRNFVKGRQAAPEGLEGFADKHLLPHLIRAAGGAQETKRSLALWSAAWLAGVLALAGPRWGYTDVQAYLPERDLVVVLSLSTTMDAQDVQPSRLARSLHRRI